MRAVQSTAVGEEVVPGRAPPPGLAAGAGRSARRTLGQGCSGSGRDACWPPGQDRAAGLVAIAGCAIRRPPGQALLLGCEATRALRLLLSESTGGSSSSRLLAALYFMVSLVAPTY